MNAIITRNQDDGFQTTGTWESFNSHGQRLFSCCTLELPWKDNKHRESCVPKGIYIVHKRSSEKYHEHFHLTNVEDRDLILVHNANFVKQLLGCIAVGDSFKDISGDGKVDVLNSQKTLAKLYSLMPDEFELTIV